MDLLSVFAQLIESIDPRLWEFLHPHVAHVERLVDALLAGF